MKKRKSLAKLTLNKSTVANLNLRVMRTVKGGEPPATEQAATHCCPTFTCPPPVPESDNCPFTYDPICIDTGSGSVLTNCYTDCYAC
jgi:hypothetical protein